MQKRSFIKIVFAGLLLTGNTLYAQQKTLDSLKKVIAVSHSDSAKISAYLQMAEIFAYKEPDTMFYFSKKAFELVNAHVSKTKAEEKSFHSFRANTLNDIGYYYFEIGDNEKALTNYKEALGEAKTSADTLSLTSILINTGMVYRTEANLPLALDNYLLVQKMLEKANDKSTLSVVFNNIGRVYEEMGDSQKTREYVNKALALALELNDQTSLISLYMNKGIHESNSDHYKASIGYYQKALDLLKLFPDKRAEGTILGQLATSLYGDDQIDLAMSTFQKSIHLLDSLHANKSLTGILFNTGKGFYGIKKYDEALPLALRSMELALKLNSPYDERNSSNLLYLIYKAQGKTALSLEMLELNIRLKDSLMNDQTNKLLVKKQFQYEYEKRSAVDEAQHEKERSEQEAEKRRARIVLYAVCTVLVFVMLFAVLIFRSYREKQKANIAISEQKQVIEEKQKEILDSIHYAKRIQNSLLPTERYISGTIKRLSRK